MPWSKLQSSTGVRFISRGHLYVPIILRFVGRMRSFRFSIQGYYRVCGKAGIREPIEFPVLQRPPSVRTGQTPQDLWDVSQALYVVVGQRAGCGQFLLNSIRAGYKCALTLLLGESRSLEG